MRLLGTTGILIAGLMLSACTTVIGVEKVNGPTDEKKGLRFALPAPFLLVTPRPDGGIDVEVKYFPDPENEYAIHTWSLMSAYTLEVNLEGGLLKDVTYKPNDSAVVARLVESAGKVTEAKFQTEAAAEKAKAERVASARTAARKAEDEVAAIEAELRTLEDLQKEGKDVSAKITDARIRLAVAKARAESARAGVAVAVDSSFNVPHDPKSPTSFPVAWGAVLYRIVETPQGVALRRIADQKEFETARRPEMTPSPQARVIFRIEGSGVVTPDKEKLLRLTIKGSSAVQEVLDDARLYDSTGSDVAGQFKPLLTLQPGGSAVVVDFNSGTPTGEYRLSFGAKTTAGGSAITQRQEVRFRVHRP